MNRGIRVLQTPPYHLAIAPYSNKEKWSGLRSSNSLPPPWQGGALPDELNPHNGDFYTVGEVLEHTLAGISVSLGLSMNFEAVTAQYVDVQLERKKEVLDAYHEA